MTRLPPVRPDYAALAERNLRPATYLARAVAAHIRSHIKNTTLESAARALFGNDTVTNLILRSAKAQAEESATGVPNLVLRAATAQAETGTTGWAAELARLSIYDTIAAVATLSAAADLITRGTLIPFDGFASIRVPGRAFAANNADAGQWVAEGAPIPNRALSFTSGPTLTPKKVGVLTTFSREQAEASAIEVISQTMISEAVGVALDTQMFSATAGDATKPAGLLVGATPITGTTGMSADLGKLVGALAANHGGKTPLFVAAPQQAVTMKALLGPHWDYPIVSSAALAAGTVIAIELASFVSAFAPQPEFATMKAATIHMEDTSPQDITGGTPSPAVPVKSYFQTDSVGLRMILRASWGMRATGHVQVVTGATW